MANYDVRWEGDGTKEILGHSLWVNQDEMNKPGRHVVYTYGGKYIPSPSRQKSGIFDTGAYYISWDHLLDIELKIVNN